MIKQKLFTLGSVLAIGTAILVSIFSPTVRADFLGSQSAKPALDTSGVIEVDVVGEDTQERIPAVAYLYDSDNNRIASKSNLVSNPFGQSLILVQFDNLDTSKSYKLFVDGNSGAYLNQLFDGFSLEGFSGEAPHTPIVFTENQTTTSKIVSLSRGAVIEARILDANTNEPITNTSIPVDIPSAPNFPRRMQSDSNGIITISSNLYSGEVNLSIHAFQKYLSNTVTVNTTEGLTSSVDITLDTKGVVSGSVKNLSGEGLAGISMAAYDHEGSRVNLVPTENHQNLNSSPFGGEILGSDINGNFEFYIGETGEYYLQFKESCVGLPRVCYSEQFYIDSKSLEDATPIPIVSGETTSDIDVILQNLPSLSGKVTAADTGDPVEAKVLLLDSENSYVVDSTTADRDTGAYHFQINPGLYYLRVIDTNYPYLSEYYDSKDKETADPIQIDEGDKLNNIDFTLDAGAKITGTIKDSKTGEPVSNGVVYIYDSNKQLVKGAALFAAFEFDELSAGTYYIGINNDGYSGFYAAGSDLASATPISVEFGEEIEISFDATPWAVLSGVVSDSKTGEPVQGAEVLNPFRSRSEPSDLGRSYTSADGRFSLQVNANDLSDSKLTLHAKCVNSSSCDYLDQVYGQTPISKGARFIEIENGMVYPDIEILLYHESEIKGVVKNKDGKEYISATIEIFEVDDLWNPVSRTILDCDFDLASCEAGYSAELPPGEYLLRADPREEGASSSWHSDELGNPIVVPIIANQDATVIDFNLEGTGSLTGKLIDKNTQEPIVNATVKVFKSSESGYGSSDNSGTTNEEGEFSIPNLHVGEHYLKLEFESDYPNQFVGGGNSSSAATRFAIKAGEVTSQEIELERESAFKITFLDAATQEIIDDTTFVVSLYDQDQNQITQSSGHSFETSTGELTVDGLVAGDYHPWAVDLNGIYNAGYHLPNRHNPTQTPKISVSPESITEITIELSKAGSLEGVVVGRDNQPVTAATVYLYLEDEQCGGRHAIEDIYLSQEGTFAFKNLIPNKTYGVEINPWDSNEYGDFRFSNIGISSGVTTTLDIDLSAGGQLDVDVLASSSQEALEGRVTIYQKLSSIWEPFYFFREAGYIGNTLEEPLNRPILQEGEYYIAIDAGEAYTAEYYDDIPTTEDQINSTPILIKEGEVKNLSVDLDLSPQSLYSGSISGFVYSAVDGEGLPFVNIKVYQLIGDELKQITIDRTNSFSGEEPLGEFKIEGLQDGEYYLHFEPQIYPRLNKQPAWLGGTQTHLGSQTIVINNSEVVSNANIGLEIGGTITAISKQPAFQSLFNAANRVDLYDSTGKLLIASIESPYSHEFSGLWPGDYYLLFNSYNFTTEEGCNPKTYHGEWYGGSSNLEDATPLTIEGTETIRDVTGHLSLDNEPPLRPEESNEQYQVTGRVVDTSGNPVEGVLVTAATGRSPSTSTLTNANGEYTLSLENGSYTLTFSKDGYDFSDATLQITIDGGDQATDDIVAPEAVEVTPTPTPPPVETPEPPAEDDTTIYLPVIER